MKAKTRLDKLYAIMRQAGLDLLALIPGQNHRYLLPVDQMPVAVIPEQNPLCRLREIGVRIEDNVLINEDGVESLTCFPRGIQVV